MNKALEYWHRRETSIATRRNNAARNSSASEALALHDNEQRRNNLRYDRISRHRAGRLLVTTLI